MEVATKAAKKGTKAITVAAGEAAGMTVSVHTVQGMLDLKKPLTIKMLKRGLNVRVLDTLSKHLDIPKSATMTYIGLPRQTYTRRKEAGRFNSDESDRIVRYAELLARAADLLGDEVAAAEWLRTSAPALNSETPLEHASTELGARSVLQLIGRLEHGIPA